MTTPHQYESFLRQQARQRNVQPNASIQELLKWFYATLSAIQEQLFVQNLANISEGFLVTIEDDIRHVNFYLLKLSKRPGSPDLSVARRYLDEAYGQIVVALNYYQVPKEEPDTYKRLTDRNKALRIARNNLERCLQQWVN